jgi:hypothetical protein
MKALKRSIVIRSGGKLLTMRGVPDGRRFVKAAHEGCEHEGRKEEEHGGGMARNSPE